MKYTFHLDEYYDIMDEIYDRMEREGKSFIHLGVVDEDGWAITAYSFRVVIPELNISAREGIGAYNDPDGKFAEDQVLLYPLNETDPENVLDVYSNCTLPGLIAEYSANNNGNDNPTCYIDDEEFVIG